MYESSTRTKETQSEIKSFDLNFDFFVHNQIAASRQTPPSPRPQQHEQAIAPCGTARIDNRYALPAPFPCIVEAGSDTCSPDGCGEHRWAREASLSHHQHARSQG